MAFLAAPTGSAAKLVGTTKALAYAIHNQTVSKRNTKLKERLNNKL